MNGRIIAIDAHTHINSNSQFDYKPPANKQDNLLPWFLKENQCAFVNKMIATTFSAAVHTDEVLQENEYIQKQAEENESVYFYVVIDPRNDDTFLQAEKMLSHPKCVGIKIHPSNHKYTLDEFGDKIFQFASKHKSIVLIHPDADVDYILPFADRYPDVTFIMAHAGTYSCDSYVRAINNAKHGNVYTDTSGRASTYNSVIEYIVSKAGSEKILFGTDMYSVAYQRGRIEYAVMSEKDKENILRNNAERLFGKFFK